MELEDFKKAWSEYDNKLSENLKTNNELLKRMNLNNAKSSMDTPRRYEMVNVVLGFAFILLVINYVIKFSSDYKLLISGILTSLWAISSFILSVRLLNSVTKVDFNKDSILKIQKQLIEYKKKFFGAKRFMTFTGPLFVIVSVPLISRVLVGVDIFKFPSVYIIAVAMALLIGYPVSVWINKNWYENKIIDTDKFLDELNSFEKEK
ncbi:hypothetical protein [uncultured Sunxiuqinia sp.]|uniref:hypothetical protein n=1 Tax=uncultured Sunxiuqinia sp. TaxID=1573825 RepID=UPI002AA68861|nr:hypothetical protein [uncultured Sunxiuqinia sp.]